MTRDQWIQAYFMEFVECCDCDCNVALSTSHEAAQAQERQHGPNACDWQDPVQAVQQEIHAWEAA